MAKVEPNDYSSYAFGEQRKILVGLFVEHHGGGRLEKVEGSRESCFSDSRPEFVVKIISSWTASEGSFILFPTV